MLKTSLTLLGSSIRTGLSPVCGRSCAFLGLDPHGVNNGGTPAEFGGDSTGVVSEDGTLQATGTLTVTDPDSGEDVFIAQVDTATSCGTFNIDAAGNWTFNLDNASEVVQALNTGEYLVDQISVFTAGGDSTTVSITVNGLDEDGYGPELWLDGENITANTPWVDNGDSTYSINSGTDGLLLITGPTLPLDKKYRVTGDATIVSGSIRVGNTGFGTITASGSFQHDYDPVVHTSETYIGFKRNETVEATLSNISIREYIGTDEIDPIPSTYTITPLLESVGITIDGRASTDAATVLYRESGTSEWFEGMPLIYEASEGALTGCVFYLTEDTEYEIKIRITKVDESIEESTYTVTTRTYPTIDPAKDYALTDVYSGGQLDIETLGLAGADGAWVRIKGNLAGSANEYTIDGSAVAYAVKLASANNYIVFEDIVITGGIGDPQWNDNGYGVKASGAHHLWFKNVDISNFGRSASSYDGNKVPKDSYGNSIYKDAGLGFLGCGVVVVEDCAIHHPNCDANAWGEGVHPEGCCAIRMNAYHSTSDYRGQFVVRNNLLYGHHSTGNRFGDVIESDNNFSANGGFVRDSAIYNNWIAYAQDDVIELDGGQNRVAFYDNEVVGAYCGVSTAATMKGPCYVFNNYIHNMGDSQGNYYAAFKAGGKTTQSDSTLCIYYNLVKAGSSGIAPGSESGDHIQLLAKNNIFIHNDHGSNTFWPYADYGESLIPNGTWNSSSELHNNYMWNLYTEQQEYSVPIGDYEAFYDPSIVNQADAISLWNEAGMYRALAIPQAKQIKNITKFSAGDVVVGKYTE